MEYKRLIGALAGVVVLVALLVVVFSSGGGQYNDVKRVLRKQAAVMEEFIDDMDKAASSKRVAKALDGLTDSLPPLFTKARELEGKYPELQGLDARSAPEDLRPLVERLNGLKEQLNGAMRKVLPYGQDPDVQTALKRFLDTIGPLVGRTE